MGARSDSQNTEGLAKVNKHPRCKVCNEIVGQVCLEPNCPHPKVETKRKPIQSKPKQSRLRQFINKLKGKK